MKLQVSLVNYLFLFTYLLQNLHKNTMGENHLKDNPKELTITAWLIIPR